MNEERNKESRAWAGNVYVKRMTATTIPVFYIVSIYRIIYANFLYMYLL